MAVYLKRILFTLIMLCVPLLFMEVFLRVYFAFQVGPNVLMYGTSFSQHQWTYDPTGAWMRKNERDHNVDVHDNVVANYSKYFPNQKRVDHDENGEVFKVTINSRGFRGKEFETKKAPGVIRVVTLGASSTFGFHDRDDETYPHYLEQLLNDRLQEQSCKPPRTIEVINLGIPHLTTDNIYSLFMNEAIHLEPDIVSFYEGINDASREKKIENATETAKDLIKDIPFTVSLFRELRWRSITFAMIGNLISTHVSEFTAEDFDEHIKGRSKFFLGNISLIFEECTKRGIAFVVANQQAKSLIVDREDIRGLTYEQEVLMTREKLETTGRISGEELAFLSHQLLMRDLRDWAESKNVPFVDVITALDQRRDVLASWVHLTPEGNRIIANAFADQIIRLICQLTPQT